MSCRLELGHFRNAEPGYGWTNTFVRLDIKGVWPFRYTVPMYEYFGNPLHPLTYVNARGWEFQPDRHAFYTDGGTIPPPARWFYDYHPLRYPRSFSFHDSGFAESTDVPGCEGDPLHGLWVRKPGEKDYSFEVFTSTELNALLRDMVRVEGASDSQARKIERACNWFGKQF
jgi:hypothetical protein